MSVIDNARLGRMADALQEDEIRAGATEATANVAESLRKARHAIEDARAELTRIAVGDLMQVAAHQHSNGCQGPVEFQVL